MLEEKKLWKIEAVRLLGGALLLKEEGLRELVCVISVVIHIMIILESVGGGKI